VKALGELRALGAGVLVVAKRDRLARDVYVAATIERAVASGGARVVSADGTANGDASRRVHADDPGRGSRVRARPHKGTDEQATNGRCQYPSLHCVAIPPVHAP
jgi:hypothetical protein